MKAVTNLSLPHFTVIPIEFLTQFLFLVMNHPKAKANCERRKNPTRTVKGIRLEMISLRIRIGEMYRRETA